jgi:hypothetical protein
MATFLRNIHGALTLAEMPGIYSAFSLKPSAPSFLEVSMRFTLTPFFFAGHTNSRDSLAKVILRTSLAVAFVTAAIPAVASVCPLNSSSARVQHVIYIQFDNTHFTRDNPNIPSDLEQMPHLLNFIKQNGTLLANHHTPLISHTATDILTSLTGVSFAYWTDPLFDPTTSTPTDTLPNMLTADGKNAPAPWVPFTRAGCNVGAVATANTILENIATDIPTVFGAGSTQAAEVAANPGQAFADFVGIGVHCAAGDALCSAANGGEPDLLGDEPGGYAGFSGLFGHKYVAPQISPSGLLTDLNGNVIQGATGHVGFPGFDGMSAAVSLSYVAGLQEHGVPITYAYISDAHDKHPSGPAYGPGEAGYGAALAAYDDAFNKFFSRLAADGITRENSLFVVTADEGDHFVGGAPSPANCDGINLPCTYAQIGEINTNLAGLLATEQGITTPFKVHSDDAPTIYITGNPVRTDPVVRTFAHGLAGLTALNPITGNTDTITRFLADPVEMKLLHMITADPARTPNLVMFADPDYFLFAGAPNCTSACVVELPGFAWNHGDVQKEIVTTWLGLAGPGVRRSGVDRETWSDHTDIRPTILALVGLQDDYSHDGRVLAEDLRGDALPSGIRRNPLAFTLLAQAYKQINAPVGQFGQATLKISTSALVGDDQKYNRLENRLTSIGSQRDALAAQIIQRLEAAEFDNQPLDWPTTFKLLSQANQLLERVSD